MMRESRPAHAAPAWAWWTRFSWPALPAAALALVAPVLALYAGQLLIGGLPRSQGWGLSLIVLGLLLLYLRLQRPELRRPADVLQIVIGLLAILPLALDVDGWKGMTSPGQLLAVWGLGCVLVALAVLRFSVRPIALDLRLEPWTRFDWLAAGLLLAGGLALRLPGLETIPLGVDPDEGSFALSALDMLAGRARDPFATGWVTHPTLQFYLNGVWIKLFGRTLLAMRLPSVIMGSLAVVAVYLLARVLFGRRLALLAGLLALGSDVAIQYSRLGVNNISDMLFMAWTLAALWFAGASGRPWGYAAAGAGLGLAQYYYFGNRAIPFVVLATVVIWLLADARGVWRARYLLLGAALVALAVGGPLFGHWLRQPASITEHLDLTMPFSNFAQVKASRLQIGVTEMWWRQLRDSLGVFTIVNDRGSFYHPNHALVYPTQAPIFLLGLLVVLAGWRRSVYRGLLAWLAIDLLLGSVLMTDPAAFHRILGILPAVIVLIALGLDTAACTLARIGNWSPAQRRSILALAVLVLAGTTTAYYFRVYNRTQPFKPPDQEAATLAALDYERLAGQGRFVLVTGNGIDAAGKIYHTPITFVAGSNFVGGSPEVIEQVAAGGWPAPLSPEAPEKPEPPERPLYFYVFSDRLPDLAALMSRFPGGQVREYYRSADHLLVMTRYTVP